MRKRNRFAFLLALMMALCFTRACADAFVTPLYPPNVEWHDYVWTYLENEFAPWLATDPQEKWSAQRCREVAAHMEADGFTIADEYKDELYRTKRTHRWHAGEALSILVDSQLGEYWTWSLADKAAYARVCSRALIIGGNDVIPAPGGPVIEEVVAMGAEQIKTRYNLSDLTIEDMAKIVFVTSYGDQQLWTVNFCSDTDADFIRADFGFEYYYPSGDCDLIHWQY